MASIIEQRNIIVQQEIPKLIKALTGFSTKDENYKTCLQFCFSHFKHHRFLSVNSHEVKRDIDGICEKLRFSNFHDTEKKFKKLVEECVTNEVAVDHYEKDVMYSILNLLTTLAYDPISNLKTKLRTGQEVITFKPRSIRAPKKASDQFISSLLKDNFKLLKNDTDSELSEWTSSEDEDDDTQSEGTVEENEIPPSIFASSLKPPQKPEFFETITVENSEKWLQENIQNSWWSDEVTVMEVDSSNKAANFCKLWQKNLSDKSLGFIKPKPISLVSEYCLLREIFWMFLNPVDCKFFKFDGEDLIVRPDVTLPSTMPESLSIFLNDFLRSMNLMNRLKTSCLESYQSSSLSHTLETYFGIVQEIIERVTKFILQEEAIVKAQEEMYTIIILHKKFQPHSKMLEMLWRIHSTSVLDDAKFPPHICASYLLASLNHHVESSCCKERKNLAIVLLMACLKTYLEIFEVWWTEARLDDLKQEFLMERSENDEEDLMQPRLLVKSKEKSFYINDSVSKMITEDKIIDTMLSYAVKASFTLNIISNLDRVHEMRQIVNDSASLYEEFLSRVQDEIKKFSQKKEEIETEEEFKPKPVNKNQKLIEDIKNGMLANGDELLLLAFQSTFDSFTSPPAIKAETSHLELYDVLNKATDNILLPLEFTIKRVINELLSKKISTAESFVMNIYSNEFQVEQHLQEVRKVFFVESFELINFFFTKLFPQMESGNSSWASPYLLTVAFNDAICSNRVFSVLVNRKFAYKSVFDAVDELTLYFNVNHHLLTIFSPKLMEKYNAVFRFLIKIKYAQNILNNLRFPSFFRHRAPYANLQMIDLVIKRLSLTRFAMLHSINSLHNHLMVMLHGLCLQLDVKVAKSQNISQLIAYHEAFVEAFYTKSFLGVDSSQLYGIIIETLKLARVLKEEWVTVTTFKTLDEAGDVVDSVSLQDLDNNAIEIEKTFGVCEFQLKVLLDV